MSDLLPVIKTQADMYEHWTLKAADPDVALTPVEMSVYRMQAAGVEVLKPALIWLYEPGRNLPDATVAAVINALESWVVRRQLLRLASADMGRIVAEVVRLNRTTPADELADRVRNQLAALNSASSYWPGDAEIRDTLRTEPAFRRYPRGRMRMYLEAVENRLRATMNQPQVPRRSYPIEHVLPQKWESAWNVSGLEAEQNRAAHVHRFGNLTLLTTSLNSSVSNGPWAGPTGKKAKLHQHDTFLLNRTFLTAATDTWNEEAIDARTEEMINALLTMWPVPPGHMGEVMDKEATAPTWIEFKDLVASGLITPGTVIVPREGKWATREAVVRDDGRIALDDLDFETPSGAVKRVKGGASNGWYFWRVKDGDRLADIRTRYRAQHPRTAANVDFSRLHQILEQIPEGRWASSVELADALGTSAPALGVHIAACTQCTNVHRVLTSEGQRSPQFSWADPTDSRDPIELLRSEGIAITNGKADPNRILIADELVALLEP